MEQRNIKIDNKFLLLTSFLVLILVTSCFTTKQVPTTTSVKSVNFSDSQVELIESGDTLTPMRVWKIGNYQDSVLLRKMSTDVVVEEGDLVLQTFVKRLFRTVRDSLSMGVGIAAPQVGVLKNIIWVQRFDKKGFPFEVYLNPVIKEYSGEKQVCPEGCLSIPDKQGVTKNRSKSIVISYQSMDGEQYEETVTSFTAVVFQHEIDHLNGILFIDHLEAEKE